MPRAALPTSARALAAGLAVHASIVTVAYAQPSVTAPPPIGGAQRRPVVQTLSTDPLAAPFGFMSAEYERTLGRHGFAVGVGGLTSFGQSPQAFNDGGSETFRSLQLKLKFYPRQDQLRGLAIGITAGVAHERELWRGSSTFDDRGREIWLYRVTRARTAPTLGTTVDYNLFLGRSRRFLLGFGVGARRALGVGREGGPLSGPLIDPRLQVGFGF